MIRRPREGFAAILETMRHMATLVDPGEDGPADDVYDQQLDTPDWLAWSQELAQ